MLRTNPCNKEKSKERHRAGEDEEGERDRDGGGGGDFKTHCPARANSSFSEEK